ncbi:MAG: hypothetical protein H6666_16850 [Ardenticatenaceae bacterium]|nr:hypothetical protein [Ardenticatenaceae bacterium]
MSLDWRTDEEDDWAVEPGEGQTPRPRPTRPGRSLLLLFLLFALAAGVIYWQVARLVAQTAADTEQDVIAAAELVRFAASSGDVELFTTLLSGRDPQWTVTQQQLVGAGHLLQRQAFDLQPQLSQTAAMTVSLAPDFRSAQLWTQQPYTLTLPNGQQSQIILVQESHFRRGNSRWLYAPPPEDYWGTWLTDSGSQLNLVYPERDQAIARRLLADLDALVPTICALYPDVPCPAGGRATLRLDPDPASLALLGGAVDKVQSQSLLNLPAPSLIGIPEDEAGYQALRRGYGAALAAHLIGRQVGWHCCRGGQPPGAAFYAAVLDKQLNALGLRAWPLTPAHLESFVAQPWPLSDLPLLWQRPAASLFGEEDRWLAYALVDFMLVRNPELSLSAMLQGIGTSDSFSGWYLDYLPAGFTSETEKAWVRFVYDRLREARTPPLPLPQQDVLAFCDQRLNYYDTQAGVWRDPPAYATTDSMGRLYPLPDNQRVILQTYAMEGSATVLWQAGQPTTLVDNRRSSERWVYFGQSDPAGEQLVMVNLAQAEQSVGLLRIGPCLAGDCAIRPVADFPTWSPDGRQTLLVDRLNIYRAGPAGQDGQLVAEGRRPFWLDNERYIYFALTAGAFGPDIMLATTGEDRPEPLVAAGDWLAVLPAGKRLTGFELISVVNDPNLPGRFFLGFTDLQGAGESYIISVTAAGTGGGATLALQASLTGWLSDMTFSPDGRWLTVMTFIYDNQGVVYLYDLAADDSRQYAASFNLGLFFGNGKAKWSGDGQWLLFSQLSDVLSILDPVHNYREWLVHDFSGCTDFAWVSSG